MPRKKKEALARSLIKDRFSRKDRRNPDSFLHVAELDDGYDWGRLNLQSVTEQSSFQEFLTTATLAGTEFQAEKLNIKFVNSKLNTGLLSKEEYKTYEQNKEKKKNLLKIPRRPKWNEDMTAEELHDLEREEFLEWRRNLAILQEEDGMLLTPYEKNIEFWRQLWRVIERSDVVVQILDARNPLLFRCEDLEKYVIEVDENKINMLLLNKADFLTVEQRCKWVKYFNKVNIKAAFFSAKNAAMETQEDYEDQEQIVKDEDIPGNSESDSEEEVKENITTDENEVLNILENLNLKKDLSQENKNILICHHSESSNERAKMESNNSDEDCSAVKKGLFKNSSTLLGREDLIELFRTFTDMVPRNDYKGYVTIGLVGYPNVGKSSTINALLADKKVSVSATPGKTKHFQTLFLTKDILLCDCPGLVMPSFVSTKAEMVLNGILPIDQMRDHVPPTTFLAKLIPRDVIESEYGIMIPRPLEGEEPDRPPTAEELLNSFAYCRGFMTEHGQPDNPRASRYVLKDFVTGRLLYCVAPPGEPQEEFHTFKKKLKKPTQLTLQGTRAVRSVRPSGDDIDKAFFKKNLHGVHQKGVQKIGPVQIKSATPIQSENSTKPWKNHKEKRNKKEKLRRLYRHLDE